MKMTVPYQFMYTLLMQLAASGIVLVFGLVAFWYFTNISVAKEILSGIFMLVNFAILYVTSKKFALLDNKPYTPLKPSIVKGALFGCLIAAVNIIFVIIYRLIWISFGTETGLSGVFPMLVNAMFYYWTYPYNGIMNMSEGVVTAYSVAAMVAVPVLATLIGYIAGMKKFELSEKLDEFMYEKE